MYVVADRIIALNGHCLLGGKQRLSFLSPQKWNNSPQTSIVVSAVQSDSYRGITVALGTLNSLILSLPEIYGFDTV